MRVFASTKTADNSAAHLFSRSRGSKENASIFNPSVASAFHLQRKAICACGGGCPACQSKPAIQTKLSISEPGDIYEQEADHIAEQVMAAPEDSAVSGAPPRIQRFTGHSTGEVGMAPASVDRVLASGGRPLDPALQQDMGQRFGHDFSRVRVHADAAAEQSAREVNAHAYTVGHDMVFGTGRFAPETHEGRRLIAHELTHVVQQTGADGNRVGRSDETRGLSSVPLAGLAPSTGRNIARQQMDRLQRLSSASSESSNGGAGANGPAPAPGASCKIDVRATHIGGILSGLPIWHLFIVYTDGTGTEYFYRGGPGGSCPGVGAGGYGTIISTSGAYTAGTVDWSPGAPSSTVMSGSGACGKDACFASELSRIDGTCTPYAPTGPNSNTVAKTLLSNCGVPLKKPVTIAPGWGNPSL